MLRAVRFAGAGLKALAITVVIACGWAKRPVTAPTPDIIPSQNDRSVGGGAWDASTPPDLPCSPQRSGRGQGSMPPRGLTCRDVEAEVVSRLAASGFAWSDDIQPARSFSTSQFPFIRTPVSR